METPMLGCGVVGPVTRSRSKAGEVLSSLVGKKRKNREEGVTTNSEEEAVGLTSKQRQEYSRKDFDYPEFYRGPSSDLPIHIILATEFDPDLPANFSRQIKNSAKAMDYYNSRFNSNYVEPFNPLLMTTREVGGGYLDFIVIDTHKSGRHANEMFQAILYTSPGKEPEVLMCRPEYMPPGTRKGYRPLKVTRSRSKAGEVLSSLVGKKRKNREEGVTTNSEEEAVGLTSEQRQEYSRKDFDYPEFYRGPSSDLPIHIILATEFDPDLPANFSRQIKNSAKAMDYYNSRFNSNYVEPFNPLLMTTREVGGGYLDFIVIDTHKSGQHANEMFQAILYTSPGKEPEVLMCRPEYMPPGTRKGYRPLKVGW